MRNIALRRHNNEIKKLRKIKIVKNTYNNPEALLNKEVFVGKLVKGKVHCSCPMCSKKLDRDGWKISDRRKLFKE